MKPVIPGMLLSGSARLACAQAPPAAAPAAAVGNTGQLVGTVLDAAGKPVASSTVALLNTATCKPVDSTQTT